MTGLAALAAEAFHEVYDVFASKHLTEGDVLSVKPGSGLEGNEELRSVGIRSGVGHGEQVSSWVSNIKVLIVELLSVDGLSSTTVTILEVTSLSHKPGDDSVEWCSDIAERLV